MSKKPEIIEIPTQRLGYENRDRGWHLVFDPETMRIEAEHIGWGMKCPVGYELRDIVQAAFDEGLRRGPIRSKKKVRK